MVRGSRTCVVAPDKNAAVGAVRDLTESDLRPVQLRDFRVACQAQKASVHPDEIERYIIYDGKHGARQLPPLDPETLDDDW